MSTKSVLGSGLAGATTLTILHEIVRLIDDKAPRMDELGKQAIANIASKAGMDVPHDDQAYLIATASDLVSNGLYYSLVGEGEDDKVWLKGAVLGLTAGVGAVMLPQKMGLDGSATNRSTKTKLLTVGIYLIGGIMAAFVSKKLEERNG